MLMGEATDLDKVVAFVEGAEKRIKALEATAAHVKEYRGDDEAVEAILGRVEELRSQIRYLLRMSSTVYMIRKALKAGHFTIADLTGGG